MKNIFTLIVLLTFVFSAYSQSINHAQVTDDPPLFSDADAFAMDQLYSLTNGANWFSPWDKASIKVNPTILSGLTFSQGTGNLTKIDLKGRNLIGVLPEFTPDENGFIPFAGLLYVDLSDNHLTGAIQPAFLKYFRTIRTLNLHGNKGITGDIPAEIKDLQSLTYLDLSGCGITGIAPEIGTLTNLETLILSENKLGSIPNTIYNLKNLKYLRLNINQIVDVPAPASGFTVQNNNFVEIYVDKNKLDFCDIENLKKGFPNAVIFANPQNTISGVLPQNVSGTEGTALTLNANDVCGTQNIFQWQKKIAGTWTNIGGATGKSYTINSPIQSDNGEYQCVVNNPYAQGLTINSKTYQIVLAADWAPDITINGIYEDVSKYIPVQAYMNIAQLQMFYKILAENLGQVDLSFITPPSHGQYTISGLNFMYYPEPNYFGVDKIVYKLKSRTNPAIENTGTISITVNPVNDPPTLILKNIDDSPITTLNVASGSTVQFKAMMSDIVDGNLTCNNLILLKLFASQNGSISYDASTSIATYTPTVNMNVTDIISLVAKENCPPSNLASNPFYLYVNIAKKPNTLPVANNLSINAKTGQLITIPLPANDNETPVNNLSVFVTSPPAHSSYFNYSFGNFYYQSMNNYEGTENIKFKVIDGDGVQSNEATIAITVKYPDPVQLPVLEGNANVTYIGYSVSYYRSCSGSWFWRRCYWYPSYQFYCYWDPYNVEFSEYSRYPGSYLELVNNEPASFYTGVYQGFQRAGINTSVIRSYWYANSNFFVQDINNAFTNKFVTLNYRQIGSGRLIATRKVHISLTYRGVKSAEIIAKDVESTDILKKMGLNKARFMDDTPPAEGDTIFSSIISFPDTAVVNYGSASSIQFNAIGPLGQLQMKIAEQPKKGTIDNFVFDSFFADVITNYKADYTPTENTESWDSIKYTIWNSLDTMIQTKYIHILPVKVAPQIASIADQQINEDQTKEIVLPVTDGDNTLAELNVLVNITSTSNDFISSVENGVLKITPPADFSGSAYVEITVLDPDLQSAATSFNLTVLPQNDLPVLSLDTHQFELLYDTPFSLNIAASDVDINDIVIVTNSDLPAWLKYEALTPSLGVLSGTPAAGDAGIHTITFIANDATGSTTETIEIKVIGPKVDNPPVVANEIAPIILPKGSDPKEIDLSNVFTDPDGDAITISVSGNNNSKWISTQLNGSKLTISIADKIYTGFAYISIEAKSNGLTAYTTVEVTTADQSPVLLKQIDQIEVSKTHAPMSISLADVFSDPDGDQLSFRLDSNSNPDVVTPSFSGNNLILTFLPGKGGLSNIIVDATAYGDTVQVGFSVTTTDAPPTLNKFITAQTVFKNSSSTIDVSSLFVDPDDSKVNVSISRIADQELLNGNISDNNLVLYPASKAGQTAITLVGTSNDKTINYTFNVLIEDRAPEVKAAMPAIEVLKNASQQTFDLSAYFMDPDNDPLTFSIKLNSNPNLVSAQINGNTLVVSFTPDKAGAGVIEIKASADNKEVSAYLNVAVNYATGVSINETSNQITIWPNPTSEKVFVRYNSALKMDNVRIQLIDLAGRTIFSKKQASFESGEVYQFNFDPLESGAYLLRIKSDQKEINKKLIIR